MFCKSNLPCQGIFQKIFVAVFFLLLSAMANSQAIIHLHNQKQQIFLAGNYSYYIDSSNENINTIERQKFTVTSNSLPFYKPGVDNVWLKFAVVNETSDPALYVDIRYSNLSKITLYKESEDDKLVLLDSQGNAVDRKYDAQTGPNFVFPIHQEINKTQNYLLHIESSHPIIIPAYICTAEATQKANLTEVIIAALFTGVLSVMIIYNLFLFFAVQDRSYAVYVLYTVSLLLAQLTANGYMARYVWPHHVSFNLYAVVITSNFPVITGMIFAINFLQIRTYAPIVLRFFQGVILISFLNIIISILRFTELSYAVLSYNSLLTGILILFTSLYIGRKGYKPAYLYLVAWVSMLLALILLSLRNINVLPYNDFLSHIVYVGAAIEATLLSFALGDKINTYKKEKELSQAEALQMSKANEKLIQEQNIVLEKQVAERTYDLEKTLRELKDAQIQLVEAEKMASLGQLTAGIAHEINNPINFVKSNVSPLHLDVQDLFELITEYQKLHQAESGAQPGMLKEIRALENKLDPDFLKEEIESLIGGIEEGADRTAEIVRGLRSFSRLDESESKEVNIDENINSTLVLLRNNMPHYIKVRKHFEARAEIECYPGKLNQVFMNILTNSIHAIKAKPVNNAEEYIDISTQEAGDHMQIRIADTGIGMTEEVKHKIFEPFFTTKDVGEGTGLGMAIVFKIIEKHNGKISVQSSPGEGAVFMIEIPYILGSGVTMTENEITETESADLQ